MKNRKFVLLLAGLLSLGGLTALVGCDNPATPSSEVPSSSEVVDSSSEATSVVDLTANKTAAIGVVETYVELSAYSQANQAVITEAINTAKAAINAATTEAEISQAVAAYKAVVDALKTAAEEELDAYKVDAKAEIEGYVNLENFSQQNAASIQQVIDAVKGVIDQATDKTQVDTYVQAYKDAIDEFVDEIRAFAKEYLAGYVSAADYSEAGQTSLTAAINAGNAAIDEAADEAGIVAAVEAATEVIDAIKTKAVEEFEAAIAGAKSEIENYISDLSLYSEAAQAEIARIIADYKDVIDELEDADAIEDIVADAKAELDEVLTIAGEKHAAAVAFKEALSNQNNITVDEATLKIDTKTAGLSYSTQVGHTGNEGEGASVFDAYITPHYNSTTWDSFAIYFRMWDTSNCYRIVVRDSYMYLEQVQWAATGNIKTRIFTLDHGMKDGQEYHVQIICKGWTKAVLVDGVCEFKIGANALNQGGMMFETWETGLDLREPSWKVYTDDTFAESGMDTDQGLWAPCVNKTDAQKLEDAKSAAKTEIAEYIADLTAYSTAGQEQIASIISAGEATIDACADAAAITTAVADIKLQLDGVMTAAQEAALDQARTDAKGVVDAYVTLADYSDDNQAKITDEIAKAKTAIDAAMSQTAIDTAVAAYKTEVDKIPTIAQEEQEAAALAQAKTDGIAEVGGYVNADDYSTANKTVIAGIIDDATEAINACLTLSGVETEVSTAKGLLDDVKTQAAETAELIADTSLSLTNNAKISYDGKKIISDSKVGGLGTEIRLGTQSSGFKIITFTITPHYNSTYWDSMTIKFNAWDTNGGYKVACKSNLTENPVADVTNVAMPNNEASTVEIYCRGWTKTIYVNGVKAYTVSEGTSTVGYTFISTWETGYEIEDLVVTEYASQDAYDAAPGSSKIW